MDGTMEQEDFVVEMIGTPNQKKLKQARLPFQTISSSESLNNVSSKKRKLSSPSSTNLKSEKIARKENAAKKIVEIDVDNKSVKDEDQQVIIDDESLDSSKKSDNKFLVKPNALTRFLQKGSVSTVSVKPQQPDKSVPVVILNRCDDGSDKEEKNLRVNDNSNNSINSNVNKEDVSKMQELSNERSIDSSLDSVNEMNVSREKLTGKCADKLVTNSDSDSETYSSENINEDNDDDDDDDDNDDDDNDDDDDDDDDGNDNDNDNDNDNADNKLNDGNGKQKVSDNSERVSTFDKNEQKSEMKIKKLTPRQLKKNIEIKKRQEERRRLRAEREQQRLEEKKKRRQEREAEKEQKRKEKEQKELKKQMEMEQKQKEKVRKERAKEEGRRMREVVKEEEKRRKEEERLELERTKQKAASAFVSFFVPKKQETKPAIEEKVIGACNFMPFEIKSDMKMAPISRRSLNNTEKLALDAACFDNTAPRTPQLYLDDIKTDKSNIHRCGKTWPVEAKDDVVVLEEEDIGSANIVDQTTTVTEKHRPKLLFFVENRRPPYWGTWRKKSNIISSRRPFSTDTKWFDYEIDSDEEWEEEEPGESLRGSDDEKDEENPDDDEYDVDNEFMVPHGYLSDEEARADGEDEENMSPEVQRVKLKILGEQFVAEMNEKTAKIKPKIIGCIWQSSLNCYPENISSNVVTFLKSRQAWVSETSIILANSVETEVVNNTDTLTTKKPSTPGTKKTRVPEEALPELIRLIHGNPYGRPFLIKEFITYWHKKYPQDKQQLSKISVAQKIQELAKRMACPEEGPMHMKTCWYVSEETRNKYLNDDLILPNKWSYVLTPKQKTLNETTDLLEKIGREKELPERDKDREQKDKDKEKKSVPLITQFTKKITQEEMKKQLYVKSDLKPSLSTMMPNKPPKRAALISVGRGEQFPKPCIVNAFSNASQSLKGSVDNRPSTSDIPIRIYDCSHSSQKQDTSQKFSLKKDNEKL